MKTKRKVAVAERALVARINRKLKGENQTLKRTRGVRALLDLGRYYILDCSRNFVVNKKVDIEAYGRELGVLADWEALVDE